jgi:hypothetical protein
VGDNGREMERRKVDDQVRRVLWDFIQEHRGDIANETLVEARVGLAIGLGKQASCATALLVLLPNVLYFAGPAREL